MWDKVELWISLHPVLFTLVIWPVISGAITWVLKPRTPAQYAAMNPYLAAALKFISGFGLDAPHVVESVYEFLTGGKKLVTVPVLASKAVKSADAREELVKKAA